ncbi:MAG: RNA-binding protein [Deltaproteobacteria bacterium]|nr:RNA-binding protein [Deltaproteobacteria bacterium]
MSKKLFIGGINWNTNEDELRQAFAQFGEISDLKIISERDTGRSRGFGFISFVNSNDANNAINEMNGRKLAGSILKVNEAQEKPTGGNRSFRPGGRQNNNGGRSRDW